MTLSVALALFPLLSEFATTKVRTITILIGGNSSLAQQFYESYGA
jgi:hypothetical protein